ncbi:integral membrane protein DGCR2/IDD-like [Acanthaster planci]|uniref:Integral membrane protein DGCR2/IDD-like n=1 Tax=Acanthaster planci TaxID=133434 RepID=A0A8B7ZP63_ACAPL|nr:integral membrane protein DGCR2/IDD-like [Acanthaster planci]
MKEFVCRLCICLILQVLQASDALPGLPGSSTNRTAAPNPDLTGWDVPHTGAVCMEGWNLYEPSQTCFHSFSTALVQQSALDYCTTTGSSLAPASTKELQYLTGTILLGQAGQKWWLGYEMRRVGGAQPNASDWELVGLASDQEDLSWMGLEPPGDGEELGGEDKLCVVMGLASGRVEQQASPWELSLQLCTERAGFLCAQDAEMVCLDRKGNTVWEGDRYVPPGHDACTSCRCIEGRPGMCMTTMCAKPHCELYRPDPEECCQYICTDGGNGDEKGLDVSDNMRWVLTMLTSFILLGMMLFMVYRMRQKRMAYLRYRAQQMREGNMVDFEPGTGPPPPPNLDDIDGAVYREPPPPYSFAKDEQHIPTEQPPPYISTVSLPMDVNRNRDRRCVFQQDSDAVALLDSSISSEPNTPTLITAVPPILPSPPGYTGSTENSTVSSPQTEQSTPGGESATAVTPTHQTILPSINTTV